MADPRLEFEKQRNKKRPPTINEAALADYEAGNAPLADVLNLDQEDIDALRARGLAFLEAGKPDRCAAVYELLESLGDQSAAVYLVLASCCDALGSRDRAATYFTRGLALAATEGNESLARAAMEWGAHLVPTPKES
jgi:hypothetical protein